MTQRFAFMKNRVSYLEKRGFTTEEANTKAHSDYKKMCKLEDECVGHLDDIIREGKGTTLCNRTACQSDKHVVFYNDVMRKNYCLSCATDIRFCNNLDELDLYPQYNESLDKLIGDI